MSKFDRHIRGNVVSLESLRGGLSAEMRLRAQNSVHELEQEKQRALDVDATALEAAGEEHYDLAARQQQNAYTQAVAVFGAEIAAAMYAGSDEFQPVLSAAEQAHLERVKSGVKERLSGRCKQSQPPDELTLETF